MTFRLKLRVRYSECDAQGIVFNARWGDYIDLACSEYTRAIFDASYDWRLVKQTIEWKAPARFDEVLAIGVTTLRIGTTSFTLAFQIARGFEILATAETTYVFVDNAANHKVPIPPAARKALEFGAMDLVVDQSAASR